MPTYEYECEHGHRFEVEQKILDVPLVRCTAALTSSVVEGPKQCGAYCKRLISGGSGFQLQGRGWAKDNYSK